MVSKKKVKVEESSSSMFKKEDFTRENFVQGGIIRPGILFLSFGTFVSAMFLMLLGVKGSVEALKWGGSLVIFSFVLNLYGIYLTLTDHPSFFRNMNLGFKLVLFIAEIFAFNFVLVYLL